MKFLLNLVWIGLSGVGVAPVLVAAQTTGPALPVAKQDAAPQAQPPAGRVVLSRSSDDSGEGNSKPNPAGLKATDVPTAEDAERQSVTFTDFDIDVRLRPEAHQIAVRALLTVRNDGKAPLAHIPLQLSSTLNWERVRAGGRDVVVEVATLNSDSDHTGQLHEIAIPLTQPLRPSATIQLDVTYSGVITTSSQRLVAIGTPQDVALHSDWDCIDDDFTGLRGFGNAVWYPVSAVPVILGDGARLFDEIGEHKLRLSGARFRLRLTVEFPPGRPPSIALVNGHSVPLTIADSPAGETEVFGTATAQSESTILGFEAPSLFIARRKQHPGTNLSAWTTSGNDVAVQPWLDSANHVTPFLQQWLGQYPRAQLTLLDLPDPQDAPFETGAMLATSLGGGAVDQLDGILAHALTHAWMQSPRAWLSEGVAHFMGTLWLERQQGRDTALRALESGRQALALAEPPSPGQSTGQPLAQAISPVFYRTKATYVLWMLRDLVGERTLSAALRAYDPAQDVSKGFGKDATTSALEALVELAGNRHDVAWFFTDWVDQDRGLPDLAADGVFPSAEQAGNWLVAVNVSNTGYIAAEVPVSVRSAQAAVTQRVRVPARGKTVQRILIQGKPTEVQINDGTVPESQASVHLTSLNASSTGPSSTSPATPNR